MTSQSRILGLLGVMVILSTAGCRGSRTGEGPSDRLMDPLLGFLQHEQDPSPGGRGNDPSIARDGEAKGRPDGRPVARRREEEKEQRPPAPYRGRRERGIAPPPPPANLAAGLQPPNADTSDLRLPANERAALNQRENPPPPRPSAAPSNLAEPPGPARAVSLPNAALPRNGIILHPAVPLEPGLTPPGNPLPPQRGNMAGQTDREIDPVQAIPSPRVRNPQLTGATVHSAAPQQDRPEVTTIEQARAQLAAAGIDLDSATLTRTDSGLFQFACRTVLRPGSTTIRRYEGTAETELDAMRAVLKELGK